MYRQRSKLRLSASKFILSGCNTSCSQREVRIAGISKSKKPKDGIECMRSGLR